VNLQTPQVLLVMDYRQHEVLIPFTDGIVLGIDREQQDVKVDLPEGLLDVYLNQ
jgi:16S rRNA processing protein RimM